jgi:hypothetical protein
MSSKRKRDEYQENGEEEEETTKVNIKRRKTESSPHKNTSKVSSVTSIVATEDDFLGSCTEEELSKFADHTKTSSKPSTVTNSTLAVYQNVMKSYTETPSTPSQNYPVIPLQPQSSCNEERSLVPATPSMDTGPSSRFCVKGSYYAEELQNCTISFTPMKEYIPKKKETAGTIQKFNFLVNGNFEVYIQTHSTLQLLFNMSIPKKKKENEEKKPSSEEPEKIEDGSVKYSITADINHPTNFDHKAICDTIDMLDKALINHILTTTNAETLEKKFNLPKGKENIWPDIMASKLSSPLGYTTSGLGARFKVDANIIEGKPHFLPQFIKMPTGKVLRSDQILKYARAGSHIIPQWSLGTIWLTNNIAYGWDLKKCYIWKKNMCAPDIILPSRDELPSYLPYPVINQISPFPMRDSKIEQKSLLPSPSDPTISDFQEENEQSTV